MSTDPNTVSQPSVWNKNSWHWEEKNVSEWVLENLKTRFTAAKFDVKGNTGCFTDVSKLNGEAFVNLRKGKKIYGLDMNGKLKWKVMNGETVVAEGSIELAELTSEDPVDGKVSVNTCADDKDDMRVAVKSAGNKALQGELDSFMIEFKEKY